MKGYPFSTILDPKLGDRMSPWDLLKQLRSGLHLVWNWANPQEERHLRLELTWTVRDNEVFVTTMECGEDREPK